MRRWVSLLTTLAIIAGATTIGYHKVTQNNPSALATSIVDIDGTATGFYIGKNTIVTNKHVGKSVGRFVGITDNKGESSLGVVIKIHPTTDLAIIVTSGDAINPATLSCVLPVYGERVSTIGRTDYVQFNYRESVVTSPLSTNKDLSDFKKELYNNDVLAISLSVIPGSSGSPIWNSDGSVLGVVSSVLSTNTLFKDRRETPIGVSWGVPSHVLCDWLDKEGIQYQQSKLDFIKHRIYNFMKNIDLYSGLNDY